MSRFLPSASALRTGAVLAAVLVIPLVTAALVAGGQAVLPAAMGLASAAFLLVCDWRQALLLGPGLVLTGTLAAAATGTTWAVVLVVVLACLAAGVANVVSAGAFGVAAITAALLGIQGAGSLSPWAVGLTMAGVCAYTAVVIAIAKVHMPPQPLPLAVGLRHGLVMATACGVSTAIVVYYQWPRGYWLVLTLAIILRPYAGDSLKKTRDRITGTVAGALLAALLAPLPRPAQIVLAAVCLALMFAFMVMGDYVLQVTFTTLMVVFLVSSGSIDQTLSTDGLRLLYTAVACAVGAGLALLLASKDVDAA